MGPRRPRSIKTAKINFPGIVSEAVIPVDNPTVPSAEIHSNEASRNQRGRSAAFPPLSTPKRATSATNDNASSGDDVIVTFESNTAGVDESVVGLPATSATSGTFAIGTISHVHDTNAGVPVAITELHSNYKANAGTGKKTAGLSGDQHSDESWDDVRYPEDDNQVTTVTTTAVAKSRLTWL